MVMNGLLLAPMIAGIAENMERTTIAGTSTTMTKGLRDKVATGLTITESKQIIS